MASTFRFQKTFAMNPMASRALWGAGIGAVGGLISSDGENTTKSILKGAAIGGGIGAASGAYKNYKTTGNLLGSTSKAATVAKPSAQTLKAQQEAAEAYAANGATEAGFSNKTITYHLDRLFGIVSDTALQSTLGADGKVKEGFQELNTTLTNNMKAREDARTALQEGFQTFRGQEGNAQKTMKDFVKTQEGSGLLTNLQGTNQNLRNTVSQAQSKTPNLQTQTAYKGGQQSVGMMGGLKNTWNKAGTMGKAGMVGAGVVGAGLMAKGIGSMFGGKKDDRQS